jgi:hypothetical protein
MSNDGHYTVEEMALWGELTRAGRHAEVEELDARIAARRRAKEEAASAAYQAEQAAKELEELREYKRKAGLEFDRANRTFADLRDELAAKDETIARLAQALRDRGHGGMADTILGR